jgi:hypothetical protein
MNTRETRDQKEGWIPKKERVWVIAALIITVPLVLWEITGAITTFLSYSKQQAFRAYF